jgi:hypothetical protein
VRRIAGDFGPAHPFSPSQLETLALCPFQFFLRYVLHLEPADEREELDDDRTARGSLIHRVLEGLHAALRDAPARTIGPWPSASPGGSRRRSGRSWRASACRAPRSRRGCGGSTPTGCCGPGAGTSSSSPATRTATAGAPSAGHVEVVFGDPSREDSLPGLDLGPPADGVRLQGMIDRIDLVRHPDRTLFRVIDYKTGPSPGKAALKAGLALQLPLYALAVERILLAEQAAAPLDVGYWGLAADGFKPCARWRRSATGRSCGSTPGSPSAATWNATCSPWWGGSAGRLPHRPPEGRLHAVLRLPDRLPHHPDPRRGQDLRRHPPDGADAMSAGRPDGDRPGGGTSPPGSGRPRRSAGRASR